MVDLDLCFASVGEVTARIAAGDVSPVELLENALSRIDRVDAALNCFASVWDDAAMSAALSATDAVAAGARLGPLQGVPIALKDTTPTAGHRTSLGSTTHAEWIPAHDASIVESLRRAGAVIVGKTTTPEFASHMVCDSPLLGTTRNPWDPTRTPGGSSGGSAVAVATGCVYLAEGTDMGGSVRIPAAWCGIVGLKPGLGRIPMDVLPGLFDPLSHHGGLARSVEDVRRFLAATQGQSVTDVMSLPTFLDLDGPLDGRAEGLRVGLSVDLGCWAVDPAVERAVRGGAEALRAAGAVVDEVAVGLTPRDEWVWIELWGVFMAGLYGHLLDDHRDELTPLVVTLIELGSGLSATHVKRLDIERTDLWRRVSAALDGYDALLCPTMSKGPVPAALADQPVDSPPDDGRNHSHTMTSVWNLIGPCPAMSIPCGFDDDGIPVGLQIVGHPWQEETVMRVGRAAELAIGGFGRPPELQG